MPFFTIKAHGPRHMDRLHAMGFVRGLRAEIKRLSDRW